VLALPGGKESKVLDPSPWAKNLKVMFKSRSLQLKDQQTGRLEEGARRKHLINAQEQIGEHMREDKIPSYLTKGDLWE